MNLPRIDVAQSLLDRAELTLQAGRVPLARDLLCRALAMAPDLPRARLLEARLHLAQQRPADALSSLDMHTLQHPDQARLPEVIFLRAQAALASDDDKLAQSALDEVISMFPEDVRTWRLASAHHLLMGHWEQARLAMEQLVRLAQSEKHVQRLHLELLGRTHPESAAELALRQAEPTSQDLMSLRAARNLRQGERDCEAMEIYRTLLQRNPDDPNLLREAAELADSMGDVACARGWLKHALQHSTSEKPAILRQLALLEMRCGSFARAGRRWFELQRLQGDGSPAQAGLMLCALLTRHDRLAQHAQTELNHHSSVQERRRWMAELWPFALHGRLYRQAAHPAKKPSNTKKVSLLNDLIVQANHTLEQHVKSHPDRADAHYHLAVCQSALGNHLQASQSVGKALTINPGYRTAQRLRSHLMNRSNAA